MRGVLFDLAPGSVLGQEDGVGPHELEQAITQSEVRLRPGDAALLRTGWMRKWESGHYTGPQPGLTLAGAKYLVDRGAVVVGADNAALELLPSPDPCDALPVHSYLLYESGVFIIENLMLDRLASSGTTEFLFIALPLKVRGATAAPLRPVALPLRS
jgi:kynurenine formamidase